MQMLANFIYIIPVIYIIKAVKIQSVFIYSTFQTFPLI